MTTSSAKDARALLAVTLNGQPLVPADAQRLGPGAMVAAALKRLADMKRPRAPVPYHRAPDTSEDEKAYSGTCNTESDQ